MKAYSQDLRDRVIAAVEAGQHSSPEIAVTFAVSQSTLDKWLKRWGETWSVAALPFVGGRSCALKDCAGTVWAEVAQQPDVTLAELCERVATQTDVTGQSQHDGVRTPTLSAPRKKR